MDMGKPRVVSSGTVARRVKSSPRTGACTFCSCLIFFFCFSVAFTKVTDFTFRYYKNCVCI